MVATVQHIYTCPSPLLIYLFPFSSAVAARDGYKEMINTISGLIVLEITKTSQLSFLTTGIGCAPSSHPGPPEEAHPIRNVFDVTLGLSFYNGCRGAADVGLVYI